MNSTDENNFADIQTECEQIDGSFHASLKVIQKFSGCSNDNYLVELQGYRFVLRRYYHRDDLIMRDQQREKQILRHLYSHGCTVVAQKLLDFGTFYLIQYIPGDLLKEDAELALSCNSTAIAKAFRQLHRFSLDDCSNDMANIYAILVYNAVYFGTDNYTMYLATEYQMHYIADMCDKHPELLFSGIAHNDAHSGNIVFSLDGPCFIDFEYASQNYNFYDICCFFAEFTGIDVNFEHLATATQRKAFYTAYFDGNVDCELCDYVLDLFYVFVWGAWSLWGKYAGYVEYAARRLSIFKYYFARLVQRLTPEQ